MYIPVGNRGTPECATIDGCIAGRTHRCVLDCDARCYAQTAEVVETSNKVMHVGIGRVVWAAKTLEALAKKLASSGQIYSTLG